SSSTAPKPRRAYAARSVDQSTSLVVPTTRTPLGPAAADGLAGGGASGTSAGCRCAGRASAVSTPGPTPSSRASCSPWRISRPRWTSNATSTGVWPDPTCLMISSFPCRFWTTWTAVAPDPVLTFRTNATPLVSRIAPLDRQTTSSDHPGRSGSATVHQVRFDAAGVEHPTAEWTWEDFRSAAKTISDELGDQGVYGFAGGVTNQALVYPAIMQAGGESISEDGP